MNPAPPSMPIPSFPNEDTSTPPSSPSPQMTQDIPARPLWLNHTTPNPLTMEIDDLQIIHPHTQRPGNPNDATLTPNPQHPLLRTIVTTRKSHTGLTAAARNTLWDPIDKYNKAPMPKIHDANPTAIFDLIDLSVIDEWDNLPEGKLAAIPFGNDVDKISSHNDIGRRIFTAAAEITKAQQTAVAGP